MSWLMSWYAISMATCRRLLLQIHIYIYICIWYTYKRMFTNIHTYVLLDTYYIPLQYALCTYILPAYLSPFLRTA